MTDNPVILEPTPEAMEKLRQEKEKEAFELARQRQQELEEVNTVIAKADMFVRREYLSVLDQAKILPLTGEQLRLQSQDAFRLMKMERFVYGKDVSVAQKLRSVYGCLSGQPVSAVLILDGREDWVDFYLGVCAADADNALSSYKTFRNSLNGSLPGCQYKNVKNSDLVQVLKNLMPEGESLAVATVSGMPLEQRSEESLTTEKLDALVDGMRGKPFSMVLLAQTMGKAELIQQRQLLEQLYTQIAPLQKQDITLSENESDSYCINASRAISDSLTKTNGTSWGESSSTGTSENTPDEDQTRQREKGQAIRQMLGSAAAAAISLAFPDVQLGYVAAQFGAGLMNMIPLPNPPGSSSSSENTTVNTGGQESVADGHSETLTEGTSTTTGTTRGKSVQRSFQNKSTVNLLENIDRQLKLTEQLTREGGFKLAAYFIAGDQETAVSAANLYRSQVYASGTVTDTSPICRWKEEADMALLKQYLIRGLHPSFSFGENTGFSAIQAAQPIAMSDMPNYFALPEKSVPGLNVSDHASFARDVLTGLSWKQNAQREAQMGCVYHMGRPEQHNRVVLDLDQLTKHLFVAGATGVGKSNFCYQLLDEALSHDIKVLIVEPAKGEYARVFGGRDGFKVFGTNLRYAPLLRINPFAFPDGIHVCEHIDRLLDIFKAAWPLTAAMPAILKDSVEQIYMDKGFDMILGERPEGAQFPSFADLLKKLPQVISQSDYSGENKGNYTGALVTRVKSMTNGIFGTVFSPDEIGDQTLFDENCIVDISRVGSAETKALLMGVLVMRLSEYRMCSNVVNSKLRHLTLLEEAHHLLRRDTGASSEGVNAKEASVEMITNAIAEMRTYGEGFVIADQSPAVLHPAAIRNTQTKAFFMLPDQEDRRIAGSSVSLDEHQSQELSNLPTGVAVMYQNRWTSAVLCKVDHFTPDKESPYVHKRVDYSVRCRNQLTQALALLIKGKLKKEDPSSFRPDMIEALQGDMTGHSPDKAQILKRVFAKQLAGESFPRNDSIFRDVEDLLDMNAIMMHHAELTELDQWVEAVHTDIQKAVDLNLKEIFCIVSLSLRGRRQLDTKKFGDFYTMYFGYCMEHLL